MALSDAEFLQQFEQLSLDPVHFNHRGHLRLVWLHLSQYPLAEGMAEITQGITRYVAHLGASDKYHHTLTEAIIRIVHRRMQQHPADSWQDFLQQQPDLLTDMRALVAVHYSPASLNCAQAKQQFVPPDRQAL